MRSPRTTRTIVVYGLFFGPIKKPPEQLSVTRNEIMGRGRKTILLVYTFCNRNTPSRWTCKNGTCVWNVVFSFRLRAEDSTDKFRKNRSTISKVREGLFPGTRTDFIVRVSNTVLHGCRPLTIVSTNNKRIFVRCTVVRHVRCGHKIVDTTLCSCWVLREQRKHGHLLDTTGRDEVFKRSHVSF